MSLESSSIPVGGMFCDQCVQSIKNAVGSLNGISELNINLEHKRVYVEFDPEKIELDTIKGKIEDQGFEIK